MTVERKAAVMAAFADATRDAINKMGLTRFKQVSFFGSSDKQVGMLDAA